MLADGCHSSAQEGLNIEELQGIHVLVIDDDADARFFLEGVLLFWGAVVTATTSADATRAALIADVIVCDLAIAEAAGRDFLSRLRERHGSGRGSVPAIALVPSGQDEAGRARAAGFQRHLMKPVYGDELRDVVRELTRRRRRAGG
jgi:CheY-like chemotaxis protein